MKTNQGNDKGDFPRYYTGEVLQMLGISASTLYRLRRRMGMLLVRGRNKTRYTDAEVEALKEELNRLNQYRERT